MIKIKINREGTQGTILIVNYFVPLIDFRHDSIGLSVLFAKSRVNAITSATKIQHAQVSHRHGRRAMWDGRSRSTCFGGNAISIIPRKSSPTRRLASHPCTRDGAWRNSTICVKTYDNCHTRGITHGLIYSPSKSRRHCHRMTEEGGGGRIVTRTRAFWKRAAMHRMRAISMHRVAYALCHRSPTILHSIAW